VNKGFPNAADNVINTVKEHHIICYIFCPKVTDIQHAVTEVDGQGSN